MSRQQDKAPETSAGTLDGVLEVASSKGRTKIEGETPRLIPRQVQQGSDLDQALGGRGNSGRVRLGEAAEVATKDNGTGMDDLFGSSRSGRRVMRGERASAPSGRSDMDDLFGSGGSRRAPTQPVKESFDPLSSAGSKSRKSPSEASSLDDLFGPSKRR